MAEHYCNRHFINARYQIWFNDLPDSFSLYYPDVTMAFGDGSLTDDGLFYLLRADLGTDTYTTLGNSSYYLRNSNPYVFIKSDDFVNPPHISTAPEFDGHNKGVWYFRFTTGMGAAAAVLPDAIKQAIKLIASDMYYFREDRKRSFPMASEILLQPYKCYL